MLILGVPAPGDRRLPDEPAACSGMELVCWWVSDPISGGSPDPHQLAWTMEN
jgi:hypothetical protein